MFKKLPGGGAPHSDRIWARGEPRGPRSLSFLQISDTCFVSAAPQNISLSFASHEDPAHYHFFTDLGHIFCVTAKQVMVASAILEVFAST